MVPSGDGGKQTSTSGIPRLASTRTASPHSPTPSSTMASPGGPGEATGHHMQDTHVGVLPASLQELDQAAQGHLASGESGIPWSSATTALGSAPRLTAVTGMTRSRSRSRSRRSISSHRSTSHLPSPQALQPPTSGLLAMSGPSSGTYHVLRPPVGPSLQHIRHPSLWETANDATIYTSDDVLGTALAATVWSTAILDAAPKHFDEIAIGYACQATDGHLSGPVQRHRPWKRRGDFCTTWRPRPHSSTT